MHSVVMTLCTVCGYDAVHSVWISPSLEGRCAQCVVMTLCTVCGYDAVHSVWISPSLEGE